MFDEISRKICFLNEKLSQTFINSVSLIIDREINSSGLVVSSAALELLKVDVLYAAMRNLQWRRLPLFKAIVVEYISKEHGLKDSLVGEIFTAVLKLVGKYYPESEIDDGRVSADKFLLHLYICSATSEDPTTKIGLGRGILARIKSVAETIERSEQPHFFSELDGAIASMLVKLAEEKMHSPWIVDIYRLASRMGNLDKPWQDDTEAVDTVFKFLLSVTISGTVGIAQVRRSSTLRKILVGNEVNFINFLVQRDVFFPVLQHSNVERSRWRLSKFGVEITANAFADTFLRKTEKKEVYDSADSLGHGGNDWKELVELEPTYQEVILEMMPLGRLKLMMEKKEGNISRLSPRAFRALIRRLEVTDLVKLQNDVLNHTLQFAESAHLRRTACQILVERPVDESVRYTLEKVVRSDSSLMVRETAIEGLMRSVEPVDI